MALDHKSRDRWSLEWLLERGAVHGLICGTVGVIWGLFLLGIPGCLLLFPPGYLIGVLIWRVVGGLAGRGATVLYTPSGDSTKYVPTYSHIDAMIARGDFEGAAAAFEHELTMSGREIGVLVKAADFHLRERRDHARALTLYLDARGRGAGGPDLRRYVQQKLVDLYLDSPLRDEGRAMVELRRLIDAFPDSREAAAAREALAELKRAREQR